MLPAPAGVGSVIPLVFLPAHAVTPIAGSSQCGFRCSQQARISRQVIRYGLALVAQSRSCPRRSRGGKGWPQQPAGGPAHFHRWQRGPAAAAHCRSCPRRSRAAKAGRSSPQPVPPTSIDGSQGWPQQSSPPPDPPTPSRAARAGSSSPPQVRAHYPLVEALRCVLLDRARLPSYEY